MRLLSQGQGTDIQHPARLRLSHLRWPKRQGYPIGHRPFRDLKRETFQRLADTEGGHRGDAADEQHFHPRTKPRSAR